MTTKIEARLTSSIKITAKGRGDGQDFFRLEIAELGRKPRKAILSVVEYRSNALATIAALRLPLLSGAAQREFASRLQAAFGMKVAFRDGKILFLRSPSGGDDLALHQASTPDEKARVGQPGGFEHFGITVTDRTRLGEAIAAVEAAGGTLVQKGLHPSGSPFAYISDPDGYVIEI